MYELQSEVKVMVQRFCTLFFRLFVWCLWRDNSWRVAPILMKLGSNVKHNSDICWFWFHSEVAGRKKANLYLFLLFVRKQWKHSNFQFLSEWGLHSSIFKQNYYSVCFINNIWLPPYTTDWSAWNKTVPGPKTFLSGPYLRTWFISRFLLLINKFHYQISGK